jgi:ApbE superfamily uncharacterized protein (UPF0280 family)
MGPVAAILPCGERLHLQHGPIDLIIGAQGDQKGAFAAAANRFETVLDEIVAELSELRLPLNDAVPKPTGEIAQRMDTAARGFASQTFVTRMAAVAGSVADSVLVAMKSVDLTRAYVNNGGDIALHLTPGASFAMAMAGHDGADLGRIEITYEDDIRGIATSGQHGRSLSLGIADSVTVLGTSAANADVAATLIANAVDLPGHPAILRKPAEDLDENSDLGALPVVVSCGALDPLDAQHALATGREHAQRYAHEGRIAGAALFLRGQAETTESPQLSLSQRTFQYA